MKRIRGLLVPCWNIGAVLAWLTIAATPTLYAQRLVSVTVEPAAVPAGGAPTGIVRLSAPALAPVQVTLMSSNPMLAFVPTSVTIPIRQMSARFPITTDMRRTNLGGCAVLSGSHAGLSRTAALLVQIPSFGAGIALSFRDALPPTTTPITGTVTLSEPAPAGGARITLAISDPAIAAVPAMLTIRPGSTSLTFPISLRQAGCAVLSGTLGSATARRGLIVAPAGSTP